MNKTSFGVAYGPAVLQKTKDTILQDVLWSNLPHQQCVGDREDAGGACKLDSLKLFFKGSRNMDGYQDGYC